MPKLVRSRNYHSLPIQQSPSSALSPLMRAQHEYIPTDNGSSNIACKSPSSLKTPQWDIISNQHHHPQQRQVSEEDMYQSHHTTTSSSIDHENRDGSSNSNGYVCKRNMKHSLSVVSSSSDTSTSNLKRGKTSVCLTHLGQHEKDSVQSAMSPISRCTSHREKPIALPSECWGQFATTSNDDSFTNEVDDHGEGDMPTVFAFDEDCWDYNVMAHATSFIPIKQRPHHVNKYIARSSPYGSQPYGSTTSLSPSSVNGCTSWRAALWSPMLNSKSPRNTQFDHRNHPYKNVSSFPTMTRHKIISRSSISHHHSIGRSDDRSNNCDDQQQMYSRQLIPSSSSSSFDEFILTCPKITDSSMDIAIQRMSGLGL